MRRILALVLAAATLQASLAFLLPAAPVRSAARTQGVVRCVRVGLGPDGMGSMGGSEAGSAALTWRTAFMYMRAHLIPPHIYSTPGNRHSMVSGMVDDKTEVKVRAMIGGTRPCRQTHAFHERDRSSHIIYIHIYHGFFNVQEYFNTEGFQRWNRIYSDTADVNKVQADIRCVHQSVSCMHGCGWSGGWPLFPCKEHNH